MQVGKAGSKYGLLFVKKDAPAKKPAPAAKPLSIFKGDDSSDEETIDDSIARKEAVKLAQKRAQRETEKALKENPAAFDYDGVYDKMKGVEIVKEITKKKEKSKREAKYMSSLLDAAAERKKEDALLYEKKLLREQKTETEDYGDKPKYVTPGYREQLAQNRLWEEEQKKREAAEQNVSKKGMGSFYKNLLTNNVAMGDFRGFNSRREDGTAISKEEIAPETKIDPETIPAPDSKIKPEAKEEKPSVTEKDTSATKAKQEEVKRKAVAETSEDVAKKAKAEPVKVVEKLDEAQMKEAQERYLARMAARRAAK